MTHSSLRSWPTKDCIVHAGGFGAEVAAHAARCGLEVLAFSDATQLLAHVDPVSCGRMVLVASDAQRESRLALSALLAEADIDHAHIDLAPSRLLFGLWSRNHSCYACYAREVGPSAQAGAPASTVWPSVQEGYTPAHVVLACGLAREMFARPRELRGSWATYEFAFGVFHRGKVACERCDPTLKEPGCMK